MTAINNNWQILAIGVFAWLLCFAIYGWVMSNDYDEEDSVTFTFYCSTVLANKTSYPAEVVTACNELRAKQ